MIKDRLATWNNQLQFFLFIEAEFLITLSSLPPKASALYTSQLFPRNAHAERINVQTGDLRHFQSDNQSFTLGAYFSTAYEVASSFFGSALDLVNETNGSAFAVPDKKREGPEQHYVRTLLENGYSTPPPELISTFTFARYRRNTFIHVDNSAPSAYTTLTASNGIAINSYWNAVRDELDFTLASTGPFGEQETISLIKLLRVGVQRFDAHLASILNERGIVAFCARRLFGSESIRINADVVRLRKQRLLPMIRRDFGFSPPPSLVEQQVRTVGVR